MDHTSCKPPKCEYSKRWNKCVLPNAYNEKMAWCKRKQIDHLKCRAEYNSEDAKKHACTYLAERKTQKMEEKNPKDKVPKRKIVKAKRTIPLPNITEELKRKAGTKIANFLKKNILNKTETLGNRIKYFHYIQNFLKDVDNRTCLKPVQIPEKQMEGFEIKENIRLMKQIGTHSVNGVIYKTTAKHVFFSVASKIMEVHKRNQFEIFLNTIVTQLVLHQLSRHFVMTYKVLKCIRNLNHKNIPYNLRFKPYYVSINELAHGDLKQLCQQGDYLQNEDDVLNACFQTLLSIYTFHTAGYTHNDCHWGNFLYHHNKHIDGYYHYQVAGKDIYLKSCAYTFMIADFGLSKQINDTPNSTYLKLQDYSRILNAFILQVQGGWIDGRNTHLIYKISNYVKDLRNRLSSLNPTNLILEEKFFSQIIIPFMLLSPIQNIVMQKISSRPINSIPFIIDKTRLTTLSPVHLSVS